MTHLRRAVLMLYADAYRGVRAVGSFGLDPAVASRLEGSLEETPIAQRALAEDDVIVTSELEGQVPERFRGVIATEMVACVPVAAGGRWLGAIFADCDGEHFELDEGDRLPLRTLGRAAALVASVAEADDERQRMRQLDERIVLTREIHEQVIQRLFALSLALGIDGPLATSDRARAHHELHLALSDLRGALERWLSPSERETKITLRHLLGRLTEQNSRISVAWEPGLEIPRRLEALAQSVLLEALRNAEKHAEPTVLEVEVARYDDALIVEIANDGVGSAKSGSGLGLRLSAVEALRHHGMVEWGSLDSGRWRVRLVCPLTESADGNP